MLQSSLVERARTASHVDFTPRARPPAAGLVALAAVLSIAASIGASAALVSIGTHLFPSTRGYSHFRFFDYATLTLIGIVVATPVWPLVARVSSTPRWLLLRLAVLATIVLWIPDVYLLAKHEPAEAVAVLMTMHLADRARHVQRSCPRRSDTPGRR